MSRPHQQQRTDNRTAGPKRYTTGNNLVPNTEFDFEKANAKFDKEKIKEEVLKVGALLESFLSIFLWLRTIIFLRLQVAQEGKSEGKVSGDEAELVVPAVPKAYDKTSSFFDSLSCESLDRLKEDQEGSKQSNRRHHEKKLNVETFGQGSLGNNRYGG